MSTRWINQSQPQSLVNATFLLYLNALFAVIFFDVLLVIKLAGVAAGWGIANEKKWGYILGAIVALVPLTLSVIGIATGILNSVNFASVLISLLFQILLVGLIFHPASRSYQRIWFK